MLTQGPDRAAAMHVIGAHGWGMLLLDFPSLFAVN
jgi:hypothetical protein